MPNWLITKAANDFLLTMSAPADNLLGDDGI